MRNLIKYSIYSLILGITFSTLGAVGRFSVKADELEAYSVPLFQGAMIGVIIGIALIFVACAMFILAILRSENK